MWAPEKVDGRWASSPKENDDASMQHRRSQARDRPEEKPGTSKGIRNTMTERADETYPGMVYHANVNLPISDCLVMLDCSPQPEEAFHPKSRECQCAREWINTLTAMNCDSVVDACLRNGYISALSVCLNENSLYGIFDQMPPEELNWADFADYTSHASSYHASLNQQFESTRGPQRPFDPHRGSPSSQQPRQAVDRQQPREAVDRQQPREAVDRQQLREAVDRQQRFMEEPQGYTVEPQLYRAEAPQRYQEHPQTETFYDPTTFPPPHHVRQQSGAYLKPSSVKFDTFGAPPRFKAPSKEGQEFAPSGARGGGVTLEDLGTAIVEALPNSHSAVPTRSILKRSCINGQASHVYPSDLRTPLSFNGKKYFDEEIWSESPLQCYRMKFPSHQEYSFKGSRYKEYGFKGSKQKQQISHGTQTNKWKPVASEEQYDREKTGRTVTTNRYSDMTFLRECIRRELRGETSEGANDFLEDEIVRYKNISSRYRCDNPEYKAKMLGGDSNAQRTYLLLNMAEDLTKYCALQTERKMTI